MLFLVTISAPYFAFLHEHLSTWHFSLLLGTQLGSACTCAIAQLAAHGESNAKDEEETEN
jgi:hypothetical protein